MAIGTKIAGLVGVALSQLRYGRARTVMAIAAIALAVMAMVLLAGVGTGVLETGEEQFEQADRDLWMTGGPVEITTARGGGFENTIENAHQIERDLDARADTDVVVPLGFDTLYIRGTPDQEFETIVGTGVTAGGSTVQITAGEGIPSSDTHYNDGAYDGPRSEQVIIDQQTADRLDVDIGDTVQLGGTLAVARDTEYTVVGISPTFNQMLGTSTVVVPLSELQTLTGTSRTDPATFVTITVSEDANVEAVRDEIQAEYPQYEVRTNREQLEATVGQQAIVLVAAGVLNVLAVVAGIAMTAALFGLLIYQQREEFAALKATGVKTGSIVGLAATQGVLLGVLGGLVGVGLSVPTAWVLNDVIERIVGFEGLVQLSPTLLGGGFAVALVIGTAGAALAAWRLARLPPLHRLQGA